MSELIRINKYLANLGHCSRREADVLIADGRVKINDQLAVPGSKVNNHDIVKVDDQVITAIITELPLAPYGRQLPPTPDRDGNLKVYIALNKPQGIVCTTNRKEYGNITDYFDFPIRIYPIGRLDKDSTGLLLLTNDGDIVNKILRAEHGHQKEYIVQVNRPLHEADRIQLESGVPILDTLTKPCQIKMIAPDRFRIILTQGLNRQIRRMCEYLDYKVLNLERIRIMNITLGNMRPNAWRYLTYPELAQLEDLFNA